jgi:hypothetical protein
VGSGSEGTQSALVRARNGKKSDDLILWLAAQPVNNDLPDAITLWGDEEEAKYVESVLEAVEWKWTPSEVLAQPEALLHDVLIIGGLSSKIRRIECEQDEQNRRQSDG